MDCPECGKDIGGVSTLIRMVKVTTFACPCGRHWRVRALHGYPSVHDVVSELEAMLKKYPGERSERVRQDIAFLEVKAANMVQEASGKAKALRARAADVWERRFLKEALGESF